MVRDLLGMVKVLTSLIFNMWWCATLSAWPRSWPHLCSSTRDDAWSSRHGQGLDLTYVFQHVMCVTLSKWPRSRPHLSFSTCDGARPSQHGQGLNLTHLFLNMWWCATLSTWPRSWPHMVLNLWRGYGLELTYLFQHLMVCVLMQSNGLNLTHLLLVRDGARCMIYFLRKLKKSVIIYFLLTS